MSWWDVWRGVWKRLVRPMRCSMATRKLRGRGCNPSRRRSAHRPAASCTEVPRPRAHAGSPDGRWIGGSVQSTVSASVSRRMILRARRTPNKGWSCASMRRIARHITLRPPRPARLGLASPGCLPRPGNPSGSRRHRAVESQLPRLPRRAGQQVRRHIRGKPVPFVSVPVSGERDARACWRMGWDSNPRCA